MDFRVLGPLEVWADNHQVGVGGQRQLALLAVLLMDAGAAVSVDRLTAAVWGDRTPTGALNAVQACVSRLRQALGRDRIVSTSAGYRLELDDDELDARCFARLAAGGTAALASGDAAAAARLLTEALALWRGPAFADFADAPFARAEVARLEESRLTAVEQRIDAELRCGRHDQVVGELETLVARHPLRERLHGQLMLALYRCGRQADALDTYQMARHVLRDELGLEPGRDLVALQAAVLEHDHALDVPVAPPPHNLPSPTTRLVGRGRELAETQALLRQPGVRLLTLTGAGGIGKTRLALALADSLRADYPGGTFVAWLAAVGDSSDVVSAIAAALQVRGDPSEPLSATVARTLTGPDTLLVLDTFEHVLPAVPLVAELLASCPRLRILVTSRASLHVSGEHEYVVPPLQLPGVADAIDLAALAECEAVALFVDRAAAVRPGFVLSAANASSVGEICVRLDGLPLAIELAAARTKVLPPPELLIRLEHRLTLLTGGPRDLPARQQTLRSTIDWSYRLLGPREQELFEHIAVFVGGATLPAIEAVCLDGDDLLDGLAALIDNSLLVRYDRAPDPRYVLLDTVREYALDRFTSRTAADQVRRRHAEFFLALAEAGEKGLRTAQHQVWLQRLDAEHGNLRDAFNTLRAEPDSRLCLRLATALMRWWEARDSSEGRHWLTAALHRKDKPHPERAKALYGLGRLALFQGDYPAATVALRESAAHAERLGETETRILALGLLGWALEEQGDHAETRTITADCLLALGTLADPWVRSEALTIVGCLLNYSGAFDQAAQLQRESLDLCRPLGDEQSIAESLNNLGYTLLMMSELTQARRYLEEGLAVARRVDDAFRITLTLGNLGLVSLFEQRYPESIQHLTENARLCQQRGDRRLLGEALLGLAGAHAGCSHPQHAARLAGAADALQLFMQALPDAFLRAEVDRCLSLAWKELGDPTYTALMAEGRQMAVDDAVQYAMTAATALRS
jgi:predicted ATPase/DNA-binding SARP family transcriptional activator